MPSADTIANAPQNYINKIPLIKWVYGLIIRAVSVTTVYTGDACGGGDNEEKISVVTLAGKSNQLIFCEKFSEPPPLSTLTGSNQPAGVAVKESTNVISSIFNDIQGSIQVLPTVVRAVAHPISTVENAANFVYRNIQTVFESVSQYIAHPQPLIISSTVGIQSEPASSATMEGISLQTNQPKQQASNGTKTSETITQPATQQQSVSSPNPVSNISTNPIRIVTLNATDPKPNKLSSM